MSAATQPDVFQKAAEDGRRAVKTFLPSLSGPPRPTPPPPSPMAVTVPMQEAIRALSMARHVEGASRRIARGMPPEEQQPSPEKEFGNSLDIIHTRALSAAIAAHPEEDRDRLISEAHDSAVKWIGEHNGKVVVHGKVEIAGGTESAEKLAAKIVNGSVEDHDQREQEAKDAAAGVLPGQAGPVGSPSGAASAASAGPSGIPANGETPGQMAIDPVYPNPKGIQPLLDTEVDPRDTTVLGGGAKFDNSLAPGARPPADISNPPATDIIPSTPQIVPPGGDTKLPNGPPPQVLPAEAAKVGTTGPDGEQITQPKDSIAANQKLALQATPELHEKLSALTLHIPGLKFDKLRPLKDRGRMDQKLDDKNDPNTLSDYLGAQVAADTPQAKDALVAALQKQFKTIEVDDHFLTGKPDKAGYPSANLQVQLSNGSTAEVQIVPREVQEAGEQSHAFYKAGREAEEKGDTAERDKQWAQAGEIHTAQLEKFKARNADPHADLRQRLDSAGVKPVRLGNRLFYPVDSGNGSANGQTASVPNIAPAPQVPPAGLQPGDAADTGSGAVELNGPDAGSNSPATAGDSTPSAGRYSKGQSVTLKDGRQGEVQYHDPSMKVLRVRVDGKNTLVDPNDIQ